LSCVCCVLSWSRPVVSPHVMSCRVYRVLCNFQPRLGLCYEACSECQNIQSVEVGPTCPVLSMCFVSITLTLTRARNGNPNPCRERFMILRPQSITWQIEPDSTVLGRLYLCPVVVFFSSLSLSFSLSLPLRLLSLSLSSSLPLSLSLLLPLSRLVLACLAVLMRSCLVVVYSYASCLILSSLVVVLF
jgi:hypothetical protein